MENQSSKLDKAVKISIIFGIMIICISFLYFFVIKDIKKEDDLKHCLSDAENSYVIAWANKCKVFFDKDSSKCNKPCEMTDFDWCLNYSCKYYNYGKCEEERKKSCDAIKNGYAGNCSLMGNDKTILELQKKQSSDECYKRYK